MNPLISGRTLVAFAVMTLLLAPHLAAGETIVDDDCGFTLTLPDGFNPVPEVVDATPEIVHAFVLGDPTSEDLQVFLFIEKFRGTIGRERIKPEELPPSFKGRLFMTKWQTFEVEAFEVSEQHGEIEAITYKAQIPLKPAAIQVILVGPADRKSEMKMLLAEILSGLDGESNWFQSAVPMTSLTSSENYGFVLLTFAIVLILGGLVLLLLISRHAPRGIVLAIAVVIYSLGLGLASERTRELVLLAGAFKMLGFAGGLLGLFDLLRKRKPNAEITE